MIRRTLTQTQAATFAVLLPNPRQAGMPAPVGTGFFVSPDGYFVTAAHVVHDRSGNVRGDLDQMWLDKELRGMPPVPVGVQTAALELESADADIALLKFDFDANKEKDWLKDRTGFPFVEVSQRILEEGEPVYSFGYPLSRGELVQDEESLKVGGTQLSPRTTSAIIASTLELTRMTMTHGQPPVDYVLDKALNYGNSGGPIVATETGAAHAVCARFQPVHIPQIRGQPVMIPSLYGVATSLARPAIVGELQKRDIQVTTV